MTVLLLNLHWQPLPTRLVVSGRRRACGCVREAFHTRRVSGIPSADSDGGRALQAKLSGITDPEIAESGHSRRNLKQNIRTTENRDGSAGKWPDPRTQREASEQRVKIFRAENSSD